MDEQKSILSMQEYGAVNLKLKELMDARGLARNALARSINARFEVIDKWYRNDVEKLDLDVLARICYVLDCQIGDILDYQR